MFQRDSGHGEDRFPAEVEGVFHAYREALPDFEGSPEFMPKLWDRIESQKTVTYSFRRIANGFVTVSAALCMMFAAALWVPPSPTAANTPNTYVEVLADDATDDGGGADATAI